MRNRLCAMNLLLLIFNFWGGWIELKAVIPKEAILKKKKKRKEKAIKSRIKAFN